RTTVIEDTGVHQHQGINARIAGHVEGLDAATTEAGNGDLVFADTAEVGAAGTGVLGQGPVDGLGQLLSRGTRRSLLAFGNRRLRRALACTGATEDAAAGDDQITVGSHFQQVKAAAGGVVG